jgi:hypothetical protein
MFVSNTQLTYSARGKTPFSVLQTQWNVTQSVIGPFRRDISTDP